MFIQYNAVIRRHVHHKLVNKVDPILLEDFNKPEDEFVLEFYGPCHLRLWHKQSLYKSIQMYGRHPLHNTKLSVDDLRHHYVVFFWLTYLIQLQNVLLIIIICLMILTFKTLVCTLLQKIPYAVY